MSEDGASMFRPDIAHGKARGCVAMGIGGQALAAKAKAIADIEAAGFIAEIGE